MIQLIKDQNGRWNKPSNNFSSKEFEDNNKDITIENTSVVYLPVHNIKDIYEWYRIFKDAYVDYNSFIHDNVLDKYGFGIHGYFDKSRGETIKGWFPNLVEVKATSTDEMQYRSEYPNYYKNSKDYIQFLADKQEQLFVDGVEIFNNEKILLKNQDFYILTFYPVFTNLTNQTNTYYAQIVSGDEQYFEVGSKAIVKTSTELIEDTIVALSYDSIGLDNYVVITLQNAYSDIIEIADKYRGNYFYVDLRNQNGIYTYKDKYLTLIDAMNDKYKVYNQIVYTYQGLTNENNEYYLRRVEDVNNQYYTQYPMSSMSIPMIYSKGEAYLIKCQFNYNLSIDGNIVQNINAGCCGCSTQQVNIPHPTGPGPYTTEEDPFRLLYMDSDQAYKIFATSNLGGAIYELEPVDIELGTDSISFLNTDEQGNFNFIKRYQDQYFSGSPVPFLPATTFEFYQLLINETLTVSFNSNNNNVDVESDIIQNVNTTTFNFTYDGSQKILPVGQSFTPGSMVDLDFLFVMNNNTYTAHKELYQIVSINHGVNTLELEVYPKLNTNFYNELLLAGTVDNIFTLDINFINVYGSEAGTVKANIIDLYKKLNASFLGKVYNFNFVVDELNDTTTLELNGIRQDTEFIYYNLGAEITTGVGNSYYIKHKIDSNYTIYNQQYSISKFLNDYLDIQQVNTTSEVLNITYDTINPASYLYVGGSTKFGNKGNTIYFGSDYKEQFLDNFGKDSVLLFTDLVDVYEPWITEITYDENLQLGKIVLLSHIPMFADGTPLLFASIQSSDQISTDLKAIFDTELGSELNTEEYLPYKVDTATYAYRFSQPNDNDKLIANVTGIMFKEFNSPRVTFFKRDRFFDFDEDEKIIVTVSSVSDVNIASAPVSIDGILLINNQLVLLMVQSDPVENGVYIYNGFGNEMTRYEPFNMKQYYEVAQGTNAGKTYVARYELPLVYGTSSILFKEKAYKRKSDPRLTLKPISIYKLGVDNKTQPERKINKKYDLLESAEDVITIQPGINSINQIRFIDGLTEFNILNDINGQGQYAWILNDDTIVENAVVGCTQDNGPGTGTLIWYTGTWVIGTWCYGIWMQGLWKDGIWMDGIWNAYGIQDNNTYVYVNNLNNNLLSKWETGTWVKGTFNAGIVDYITWLDGTFNNGIIYDGNWTTGLFYNGVAKHLIWENGTFYGGDFETGIWYNGLLSQLDPTIPARFGINSDGLSGNYKDRAIWKKGIFDGGEFHSQNNTQHNSSVFYSGEFRNGNWYGGSFISGIFKTSIWWNGVWFGGYKCSISNLLGDDKKITFDPSYYDAILGLTTTINYSAHLDNTLGEFNPSFYLLGTPVVVDSFSQEAFINIWDQYNTGTYPTKTYITNTSVSGVSSTLNLNVSNFAATVSYVPADPGNSIPDGSPFICAEFSGIWKSGLWLNGLWKTGNFESGLFANGYAIDIVFG